MGSTDVSLQRFDPLSRILTYDTFDTGTCGWTELCGNHDGDLSSIRPIYRDMRPPQLSSCNFFDIGTHGPMTGNYAMKVVTRARANHMAVAIRRLTMQQLGLVQMEMYFAYKPEARASATAGGWDGNVDPSEADFGDFTVSNDVCRPDGIRAHMALRYVNADASSRQVQAWHHKTGLQPTTKRQLQATDNEPVDMHTTSEHEWQLLAGGEQQLCYNEVPTKINWQYLRWTFDTASLTCVELRVNDKTMDLSAVPVPQFPERYHGLNCLLNLLLDVRTRRPVRNSLFVDSVLVSVDW